jgi:hypothetical protein
MRRIALFTLSILAVAATAKDGYSVAFAAKPDYLVAGTRAPIAVRYELPANESATLRLEVKATGYHRIEIKTITGAGTTTIDAIVPTLATARDCDLVLWIGEDWQNPLAGLVHASAVGVVSPQRAKAYETAKKEAMAMLASQPKGTGTIGIFSGSAPWAGDVAKTVRSAAKGYTVREIPPRWLDNPYALRPELFDLIILCNPEAVPVGAKQSLPRYVDQGGRLVVLGALPFQRALWEYGGEWLEFDAFREKLVPQLNPTIVLPFADATRTWTRASNDLEPPSTIGVEDGALHLHIANLTGWDTFQTGIDTMPGDADSCVYLRAKGDDKTTQVAMELRESDGSRWIAAITIKPTFEPILVPLTEFRYWKDSDTRQRGGQGDHVRLAEVTSISFGLAHTHTHDVANGPHDIWIDDVGTANPGPEVDLTAFAPGTTAEPIIETVSPHYKTYPITNFARTRMNPMQAIMPPLDVQPKSLRSPVARPQGTGFGKNRKYRYIPIIDALDQDGRVVGAAATLLINSQARHAGMIANLPIPDSSFFANPATQQWVSALALRMLDGLFLFEGGTESYAYLVGDKVDVGYVATNQGQRPQPLRVRQYAEDKSGKLLFGSKGDEGASAETCPASTHALRKGKGTVVTETTPSFRVTTELLRDGHVIDRLAHDVNIWRPNPNPSFITTRDGDFWLDGRKWYAHGVNYMPSSGIGIEDGEYFEYWLDPRSYDPDIIERDLADCESIGFNAVSVFQYHRSLSSRNLLDLLVRCRNHGLKVNLSLRPGTPMDFPWELVKEMIEKGRLAENDDIFAYDLAWEPNWRGQSHRQPFDADWLAWVVRTHGSVQQAEAAWGVPMPRREDGSYTNPTDEQMGKEGDWGKLVRDYHRFLNDLTHERYGRARDLVRSIDPNHSVSFRMSMAGDPTGGPAWPCYDFKGLAGAIDIMEPEGYGRIGDWERLKPGWWTAAYARCVSPETPVIWAEFGYSACARSIQQATPEKLAFAKTYYNDFYTMAYRSGANGTFCWWFPGGYRWNERSDFGILNPDRSWRGMTHVIHDWSERFTTPRDLPRPDVWLEIDRNATNLGIPGFYRQTKEAFWAAVDAGKTPGLREAKP